MPRPESDRYLDLIGFHDTAHRFLVDEDHRVCKALSRLLLLFRPRVAFGFGIQFEEPDTPARPVLYSQLLGTSGSRD
jgi:hypothetical protein